MLQGRKRCQEQEQMAKGDRDLFERLRSAGLRKQAARTLSGIGDGAGKKALQAARAAVEELRSLADEIERRLPAGGAGRAPRSGAAAPSGGTARSGGATRSGGAARSGGATRSGGTARPGGTARSGATARSGGTARAARAARSGGAARSAGSGRSGAAGGARATRAPAGSRSAAGGTGAGRPTAPRGQNKAKILQALQAGPRTAAEVARETGITTGTVSTTLNKLARSGEVVKAPRGYALPAPASAGSRGSAAAASSGGAAGA
jgi:biotin operon repressor